MKAYYLKYLLSNFGESQKYRLRLLCHAFDEHNAFIRMPRTDGAQAPSRASHDKRHDEGDVARLTIFRL